MTCQVCKHEWCWICKQDFPVHLSSCANYHQYLEILNFQGNEIEIAMNSNMWYFKSLERRSPLRFILLFFFLLLICLPLIIILNMFGTPCYVLTMYRNWRRSRSHNRVNCCEMAVIIILFVFLYAFIPVVLIGITIPQIVFFTVKVCVEFGDLCKNRLRYYRKVNIQPVMLRYMRYIYLNRR
jgi:hypothetical protein